ncbi:hypothetical protein Hanom_Chr09g00780061 [Helianthus anomalus]
MCAIKEVGPWYPDTKVYHLALCIGTKCVVKRRAIVPLDIIKHYAKLFLKYVNVSAFGPVVPKVT